ncbi:MAG: sigma-70 family RNA polymerase sigma factor [Acidobacteriota bacterium]|nr:sigma-70 family RNA polymerase sigma factor [Acidobacteriota bacterium]
MDTASQPGEIALPLPSAEPQFGATPGDGADLVRSAESGAPADLLQELWLAADAESCGLTSDEFGAALYIVASKHHFGLPPETRPTPSQEAAFYRSLRLPELALAQACGLGRDAAWQRFLTLYRTPLTQAAIAITGSATLGHDLADSLYAELFGLSKRAGERRSPLASYSGRGSLLGWLRSTLAQRHIDHHRRTHRETPLDDLDAPAPTSFAAPLPAELARLKQAVAYTFTQLPPDDRFLLASYFIDQKTLLQISRILHVHEATVSRKLKRLTADMRKQLHRNLQSGGLSKRAAEEALGADPRDLDINLSSLLQSSQSAPFPDQTIQAAPDTQ